MAQELAPFNIDFTLIEAVPAKTELGRGLASAPLMAAYDKAPGGEIRHVIAAGTFTVKGDAVKMVQAIIDAVDRYSAPERLAFGKGAYDPRALLERLAALPRHTETHCAPD